MAEDKPWQCANNRNC